MRIPKCRILAVLLTLLCPSVIPLKQFNCKRGYMDITLKNSTKPIMRMNCNIKPAVVSFREKSEEECIVNGKPKIVSRAEWGAAEETESSEILPTTDCVTVDGNTYTIADMDYIGLTKREQDFCINGFGTPFNNFHIGDNGVVYEILGWDKFYYLQSGGLKCLRIAFIKQTKDGAPSPAAVDAFNDLLKTAICLGKLSPSYRIIPRHYIQIPGSLDPNSFERKDLLTWERSVQDTDVTKEKYNYGSFPIIFREEWGGKNPINTVYNQTNKIKYVLVGNSWERCFTTENCIQILQWIQQFIFNAKANLNANFFIGDDGFAYEAHPWSQTWDRYYLNKDMIVIDFFGNFNMYLPSERAMTTFRRILRLGEMWGYLSPDYKIVLKQADTDGEYTENRLDIAVREMDRFSPEF